MFRNTSADSGTRFCTNDSLPSDSSRLMSIDSALRMAFVTRFVAGLSMLPSAITVKSSAQAMAVLRRSRSPGALLETR